jgi:hypothetical protein
MYGKEVVSELVERLCDMASYQLKTQTTAMKVSKRDVQGKTLEWRLIARTRVGYSRAGGKCAG